MQKYIRILHLEDNEDDAFLIQRAIKKAGYDFDIKRVETGFEFKQALENEKWDIILSDYSLPEYSGMDAVELVNLLGIETPLILISGAIGEETAIELMRKGAADYIMKDNLSRLVPAVERELGEAEFHRKSRETDVAMESMVKSIVGTTGEDCFEKIIDGLCEWVGATSGVIGKIENEKIQTISCVIDNEKSENFNYRIDGSPCQLAMKKGFALFPQDVAKLFPEDKDLEKLKVESYAGVHLKNAASDVLGVLCVFSRQKMKTPSRIREYMEIVSAKVVSEIERQEEEKKNQALELKLRQAQKMESIGTLAGGIAHDFNNILFPIVGHTEMLLEDTQEDSPFRNSLDEIYASALRAKELVRQILTFSRQERTELRLMKIQPILKEVLKLIRSTIPTTIDIKHHIQSDCGAVKADPTQIHQILINLTTNASHAMEDTGGELNVVLKETKVHSAEAENIGITPGVYAVLLIQDTGIGMGQELSQRVFDPFFTTKKHGKGTGLGLSVVHGIVKSMDGGIHLESMPGEGSKFSVYMPIADTIYEPQTVMPQIPIQKGDEKILLVDDEEAIIEMEKQMLERSGYDVVSCTSSVDALKIFRDAPQKFDLVVTDMAMPNMSGDKLSKELIKIQPEIPILLCTGFSEKLSAEHIETLGIKGILKKPIIRAELTRKIRDALDEASAK